MAGGQPAARRGAAGQHPTSTSSTASTVLTRGRGHRGAGSARSTSRRILPMRSMKTRSLAAPVAMPLLAGRWARPRPARRPSLAPSSGTVPRKRRMPDREHRRRLNWPPWTRPDRRVGRGRGRGCAASRGSNRTSDIDVRCRDTSRAESGPLSHMREDVDPVVMSGDMARPHHGGRSDRCAPIAE